MNKNTAETAIYTILPFYITFTERQQEPIIFIENVSKITDHIKRFFVLTVITLSGFLSTIVKVLFLLLAVIFALHKKYRLFELKT